jgi:GDP/UDP-N,N'-diacetylbacillosamine 2-epimerase (hydrolysing)
VRRILYVSGSRADYGPARSVLKEIRERPGLSLEILATGMHLEPRHGETVREIEGDGFVVGARVVAAAENDSTEAMAAALGRTLEGMSRAIAARAPDVLLLLGDRGEQLAAAVAGAMMNTCVAHLCGGMVSGSIDDSIRNAITMFAHVHLVAWDEAARRVVGMGEEPSSVHIVGLPGADIRPDAVYDREETLRYAGLPPGSRYVLMVQHPVTHSAESAGAEAVETLEALVALGMPALLCNPNNDAGGRAILREQRRYAEEYPFLDVLPPPGSRQRYASLMAHAALQVGNTSSAVVEAVSVGLPVVNVGMRQRGREHLGCLVNAAPERTEILSAARVCLFDQDYRRRLQTAAERFEKISTPERVADILMALDPTVGRRPKPRRVPSGSGWTP